MKVLYLLNTTRLNGSTISFINLIKELADNGIEIHICHREQTVNEEFRMQTQGYVKGMHYLNMHGQIYINATKKDQIKTIIKKIIRTNDVRLRREIRDLSQIIEMVHPDIIHTCVGEIHCGYFAAKKYGIPHFWHLREYQTKDFHLDIYPSKEKYESYLNDSYVITITRDILQYFNLENNSKARCIYNGCFSKSDIANVYPKQKYFLCCSRVSKEKGQHEVIKAFASFRKAFDEFKLIIAGFGDAKYIDELKRQTIQLGCEDSVVFTGFQKDVRQLMDNATALVVASRFEGFGRMTAEAAFRGCLVIGRATGGTKEILDEIHGFLYSGNDKELADQMKKVALLTDNEYITMAKKSQEIAQRLYSNEESGKAVLEFYKTAFHTSSTNN